jgi:hypothetical protein
MYKMLIQPYKQTALRHLDMADTLQTFLLKRKVPLIKGG